MTRAPAPAGPVTSELAAIPEKSIAVLPFQNLSDQKENAYFADGVQDEILTALTEDRRSKSNQPHVDSAGQNHRRA